MTDSNASICFHCGQSTEPSGEEGLNRLPDGRACPACAERTLDALPPLLPGGYAAGTEAELEVEPRSEPGSFEGPDAPA